MSLTQELQIEQVSHLDLTGFSQVASGTSIRQALNVMQTNKHHVCLVTNEKRLIGIVTDRDILRKVVGQDCLDNPIDDIMTPDPVTIPPSFSAGDALSLMDRNRFRNLPVVKENGQIAGTMTHQAIINYLASRYPTIVINLPPRPNQYAETVEGG